MKKSWRHPKLYT